MSQPPVAVAELWTLGAMRIYVLVFALLPVFAAGCTHITPAGASGPDVLLSFPDRLKPGEQVVAFELNIRSGKILAVNKVPYNWLISTLAEGPQSEMSGTPNHGAHPELFRENGRVMNLTYSVGLDEGGFDENCEMVEVELRR